MDYVLTPYGIPRSSAAWRAEQVRRPRRGKATGYHATTFVVSTPVEGLSIQRAREFLERVAVAAWFAQHETTYVRARFEGNGKAVAYWDVDANYGLAWIDDETEDDLESFTPAWPGWIVRVDELKAALTGHSRAGLSA